MKILGPRMGYLPVNRWPEKPLRVLKWYRLLLLQFAVYQD